MTDNASSEMRFAVDILGIGMFALAASFLLYFFQGNVYLGLSDEGYLWYGAWRTSLGDFPVMDFESYAPGRYYWSSIWLRLFGHDIGSLRLGTAAFQGIGLFFGMMVLRRVCASWWFILLGGVILCVWMYPRYKIFEPAIALAGVYFAIRLLDKPSVVRHVAAGIFLGVAG